MPPSQTHQKSALKGTKKNLSTEEKVRGAGGGRHSGKNKETWCEGATTCRGGVNEKGEGSPPPSRLEPGDPVKKCSDGPPV